ncbi:hypothetical protein N431DRAFT_444064 [Stipitochalara longipes BDJ]|nr:hypothetical protein N431DRAFT_444064 [Stipitochalara longipes BDJ]
MPPFNKVLDTLLLSKKDKRVSTAWLVIAFVIFIMSAWEEVGEGEEHGKEIEPKKELQEQRFERKSKKTAKKAANIAKMEDLEKGELLEYSNIENREDGDAVECQSAS